MKTTFLIAALAAIIIMPSCSISTGKNSTVKYTKLPADGKNMPVQPFTAIKANGVFNIILQHGDVESVVVKDNFPEDLKVTNEGSTLVIMDTIKEHNGNMDEKTNIYITYRQLSHLEIEMVGKTETTDTIKAGKFNFESYGVGESKLLLNSDSLDAYVSGVGAVSLAGKANYASYNDDGVGALNAKEFDANELHVSLDGVGAAKVYASGKIYLHASGIGGVKYYGPAKVVLQESSGIGKIEHGE